MATLVSHVWRPSTARTLLANASPLLWPAKDPGDVLDYQFDLGPLAAGNEGDVINGVDIDVQPSAVGDLSIDNVAADGLKIILWLSSGKAGTVYLITVQAELASGRTIRRTVSLHVVALSTPPAPVPPPPPSPVGPVP